MSNLFSDWTSLPLAAASAAAVGLFCAGAPEVQAQVGVDRGYYDGGYYDDGVYNDDWYFDYYDGRTGSLLNDDEEYEYEPGQGIHEEEWYDPSDWFDNDPGIDYERDGWRSYRYDYDDDFNDGGFNRNGFYEDGFYEGSLERDGFYEDEF